MASFKHSTFAKSSLGLLSSALIFSCVYPQYTETNSLDGSAGSSVGPSSGGATRSSRNEGGNSAAKETTAVTGGTSSASGSETQGGHNPGSSEGQAGATDHARGGSSSDASSSSTTEIVSGGTSGSDPHSTTSTTGGTGNGSLTETSPSCNPACSGKQAEWTCLESRCVVAKCEANYDNCDNSDETGCETPLLTSVSHCGECNKPCTGGHANWTCSGGACVVASCNSGWDDCSPSEAGCELDVTADALNCGRCGNACSSKVCRNKVCLSTARYGNTGSGNASEPFAPAYIVGIQVYIPSNSVLTAFGVVLAQGVTTRHVHIALYRDEAGLPTTRVAATTSSQSVAGGGVEITVAPTDVAGGNYWLLTNWDDTPTFAATTGTAVKWLYSSATFGTLPATAPTAMQSQTTLAPHLYVVVAQ